MVDLRVSTTPAVAHGWCIAAVGNVWWREADLSRVTGLRCIAIIVAHAGRLTIALRVFNFALGASLRYTFTLIIHGG
jgi:hypothetical protein